MQNLFGITWDIIDGEDEKSVIESVKNQLDLYKDKPIYTVVDIGAHVGGLSLLTAQKGARKIYSFEPSTHNFRRLIKLMT